MSDLTRYRIDHTKRRLPGPTMWEICGDVDFLISEGILVPDTTLQDIADAWQLQWGTQWQHDVRNDNPDFAALLDALEGDNE